MTLVMGILKWVLVVVLCLLGAAYLLAGAGIGIPHLEYKDLKVFDLPAGGILLVAGIALAYFWRITLTKRETHRIEHPDGFIEETIKEASYKMNIKIP